MGRSEERHLGEYWEHKFRELIIPYGFSATKDIYQTQDALVWDINGQVFRAQIRHKQPWYWNDIGGCYGYEQYRLEGDLKYCERGAHSIYVIHDYKRVGRDSLINDINDWCAQDIKRLAGNIDKVKPGRTYYGESPNKLTLPICYWKLDRFMPLETLLSNIGSVSMGEGKEG